MRRTWLLALPGALFGFGLAISGMTNPAKVIGFLDPAGRWDPSLALVMLGATGSFALLNRLVHRRGAALLGGTLPGPRAPQQPVDRRLLAGAAVFGVGWGLAGLCPGPAITNLARLQLDVVAFVAAMAVGSVLAQRLFGADA